MFVSLPQSKVDNIFANATNQHDYLFGLYRAAVSNFDKIKKYDGHPEVSKATSKYIFLKAIEFDKRIHPGIFAGGLWMSMGFSAVKDVPDWHVKVDKRLIIYDEAASQAS